RLFWSPRPRELGIGSSRSSGGTACVLNSRRCGRTHCRYTGPYYLVMIAPVLVLASGVISVDFYAWLLLAVLIFFGRMIILLGPERGGGKFSGVSGGFFYYGSINEKK